MEEVAAAHPSQLIALLKLAQADGAFLRLRPVGAFGPVTH